MAHIPRHYQPSPYGHVPYYWMHEQSGILDKAIRAYLESKEDPEQLEWVIEYIRYVLDAPCWKDVDHLRAKARAMESRTDIDALLSECLEVGIDPL